MAYIYHASENDFVHLCSLQKRIPLRSTRLHQVRNDKCFRINDIPISINSLGAAKRTLQRNVNQK